MDAFWSSDDNRALTAMGRCCATRVASVVRAEDEGGEVLVTERGVELATEAVGADVAGAAVRVFVASAPPGTDPPASALTERRD
jgi:hypothetical protein